MLISPSLHRIAYSKIDIRIFVGKGWIWALNKKHRAVVWYVQGLGLCQNDVSKRKAYCNIQCPQADLGIKSYICYICGLVVCMLCVYYMFTFILCMYLVHVRYACMLCIRHVWSLWMDGRDGRGRTDHSRFLLGAIPELFSSKTNERHAPEIMFIWTLVRRVRNACNSR